MEFISSNLKKTTVGSAIFKLIYSFALVSAIELLFSDKVFTDPEFFKSVSLPLHLLTVVLVSSASVLFVDPKFDAYICLPAVTYYFTLICSQKTPVRGIYLALTAAAVVGGFVFYSGNKINAVKLNKHAGRIAAAAAFAFFVFFVGTYTTLRYLSHYTPNFDFGIFSQMYHYMAEGKGPYTTSERQILLSHFDVHFSPVLYLLLPVYLVFPSPVTLMISQAVIVGSGVVPVYLLSKKFGLSVNKRAVISVLYALHPALIGANFYYFHENCFLAPLLLWTIYFLEKDDKPVSLVLSAVFALSVCSVKEDAPVYIFVIGLFFLLSAKNKIRAFKGLGLLALSGIYFVIVTKIMAESGEGLMTNRYNDFIFEKDGSMYSIVLNVIKNPGYLFAYLFNSFKDGRIEKLEYLIYVVIPLGCLPFAIKKPSRLVLIIPMLLINLMSSHRYQYDIGYQYSYATVAFMIYLLILNVPDLKPETSKKLLLSALCASVIFFAATHYGKVRDTYKNYDASKEAIEQVDGILNSIDKDKSVTASTLLLPTLWDRDVLYEVRYTRSKTGPEYRTDVFVFDLRWSLDNEDKLLMIKLKNEGYVETIRLENLVSVYEKKEN